MRHLLVRFSGEHAAQDLPLARREGPHIGLPRRIELRRDRQARCAELSAVSCINSRIRSTSNCGRSCFSMIPEHPRSINRAASILLTPAVTTSTLPVKPCSHARFRNAPPCCKPRLISSRTTSASGGLQLAKPLFDGRALARHFEIRLRAQQPRNGLAKKRMIVNQQDAGSGRHDINRRQPSRESQSQTNTRQWAADGEVHPQMSG